jgi:hypothetical protein
MTGISVSGLAVKVMCLVYRGATLADAASFPTAIALVIFKMRSLMSGCDANSPFGWIRLYCAPAGAGHVGQSVRRIAALFREPDSYAIRLHFVVANRRRC